MAESPARPGLLRHLWQQDAHNGTQRVDRIRVALAGAHNRLTVAASSDRAVWQNLSSSATGELVAAAEAEADRSWPKLVASDYIRYFRDGNRTAHEDDARQLRARTALFTVAAAMTDEPRWIDRAADGVVLLCELSTWCWAAHERFSLLAGDVLPDPARPFVDLGAGEVLGLLAWADHVLGQRWDESWAGLRSRIRYEAERRVLEPFRTDRSWHWLGVDEPAHNWTAWVHSNMITGAVLLIDDEQTRAETVDLALEGLDRFISVIPTDGGCAEGHAYWWNGPLRAVEALELLNEASGGKVDGLSYPILADSGRFPVRMHLGGDWFVNVADGSALSESVPWHAVHRWGRRLEDAGMTSLAVQLGRGAIPEPAGGIGRTVNALVDQTWTALRPRDPIQARDRPFRTGPDLVAASSPGMLPAQCWLPETEVFLARENAATPRGLTVAMKGGHNAEPHNHNDVGAYLVAVDGVPVVVDVGRPTYTRQTFSEWRYDLWPLQSAWHNVPLVLTTAEGPSFETSGQAAGRPFRSRNVRAELSDDFASLQLEGADAYPKGMQAWRRTTTLDRQRSLVRVHDQWRASEGCRIALVQVLHGQVDLDVEAGQVTVAPNQFRGSSRRAVLRWDPCAVEPVLEHRQLDDPTLTTVWGSYLTRLLLIAHDGVEELLITIAAQ